MITLYFKFQSRLVLIFIQHEKHLLSKPISKDKSNVVCLKPIKASLYSLTLLELDGYLLHLYFLEFSNSLPVGK